MAEFETAEKLVHTILLENVSTRFSDYNLFREVVRRLNRNLLKLPADEFFKVIKHKDSGVPKYETVTRCRRKLQAKYPELKDPHTAREREERVQDFKDYARS